MKNEWFLTANSQIIRPDEFSCFWIAEEEGDHVVYKVYGEDYKGVHWELALSFDLDIAEKYIEKIYRFLNDPV